MFVVTKSAQRMQLLHRYMLFPLYISSYMYKIIYIYTYTCPSVCVLNIYSVSVSSSLCLFNIQINKEPLIHSLVTHASPTHGITQSCNNSSGSSGYWKISNEYIQFIEEIFTTKLQFSCKIEWDLWKRILQLVDSLRIYAYRRRYTKPLLFELIYNDIYMKPFLMKQYKNRFPCSTLNAEIDVIFSVKRI